MVSGKFAEPRKLIAGLTEELKKAEEIKPAAWARFVKTGPHRSRPPQSEDFWYTRSASLLRRIYIEGPVGVQRLRSYYGSRIKRGHQPPISKRSAGNSIRKILQQLEKAGYVEKDAKGGRKITAKGRKLVDGTARSAK